MNPDLPFIDRFLEILRTRRTIGAFRPEVPPREVVLTALEAACWAPNHRKTEPWRFRWLGPQAVDAIITLNVELVAVKKGADAGETKRRQWSAVPGWLLVTCMRTEAPCQFEEDYAACCCAVQNLMLALWSHNVGTKWSTGDVTRHPRFAEITQFDPAVEKVVGLIWYGYPATIPEQRRSPLSDVLKDVP
jgi:nitroreductase